MRSYFAFLFLHFLAISLAAQTPSSIEGQVLDSETREPVAHASVALPSSGTGTLTNAEGAFRLLLEKTTPKDSLRISRLGYQRLMGVPRALLSIRPSGGPLQLDRTIVNR